MSRTSIIRESFSAALPVMAGYVAIGIPCGIMEQQIGLSWIQALLVSILFYSGAGQFMIPNMMLAGSPVLSIVASVSFVNTRQILYAASLSQFCRKIAPRLAFVFSATVTDESFGVNVSRFLSGSWSVGRATLVNILSMTSWALSNAAGVLLGSAIGIPTAIASFAMTSIFICLLCSQHFDRTVALVVVISAAGVFTCKAIGLAGPAILIGAVLGVACGLALHRGSDNGTKPQTSTSADEGSVSS